MTEMNAQRRDELYQKYMDKFMAGYFDTKRDEDGMKDLKRLMELGCFGKEFCTYGIAYEDEAGIAYRTGGKAANLQEFAKYSAVRGYYPTPIICNYQRKMVPAGYEEQAKILLKKDTAYLLQERYNHLYFKIMKQLGAIPANNEAYDILANMRAYLDGRYIKSELMLFEGLLLEALNAKKLTLSSYYQFAGWYKDICKQLENDIIEKNAYEKTLSGFSYIDENGGARYFTGAFLQTVYETRDDYELKGFVVTPLYVKKYWLKDMSQFKEVKQSFEEHIRQCFDDDYWKIFMAIKSLPGVIDAKVFAQCESIVKESCSDFAYDSLRYYGRRWGAIR